MRILGLDPGLRCTGWGVIESWDSRLTHVASGDIRPDPRASLAERLTELYSGLLEVIAANHPQQAAVEKTFVNVNPGSTLKLGQARGVVLLAPAREGLPVAEYAPNQIKKALVGAGHAGKAQIGRMVNALLPVAGDLSTDAADALAVAICHANQSVSEDALMREGT